MNKIILGAVLAVVLVSAGIIGGFKTVNADLDSAYYQRYQPWNMMGRYNNTDYLANEADEEKLSIGELRENVELYLTSFYEEMEISDILIFEDTDYYFSIIEKESGRGSMELLVNPYTGYVYPEYGPNMMWNLKYGIHESSGNDRGMMRGRGMMNGFNKNQESNYRNEIFYRDNGLSTEEASKFGSIYVKSLFASDVELSEEAHEFYGYYTFHTERDGQPDGMLSVNGLTGEVWYHDWHGKLVELIME